jgi:hypothetical protein
VSGIALPEDGRRADPGTSTEREGTWQVLQHDRSAATSQRRARIKGEVLVEEFLRILDDYVETRYAR